MTKIKFFISAIYEVISRIGKLKLALGLAFAGLLMFIPQVGQVLSKDWKGVFSVLGFINISDIYWSTSF
jgi:hypothetical protein